MPTKRTSHTRSHSARDQQFSRTMRDSAQQIWLAGLGALAKTQEEGTKIFDALVEEGRSLESRTRSFAHTRMGPAGDRVSQAAAQATTRALQTWEWLEHAFEQRLAQTLKRVGAPTQADLATLVDRLDALEKKGRAPRAAAPRKSAAKATATKASVKRASARSGRGR